MAYTDYEKAERRSDTIIRSTIYSCTFLLLTIIFGGMYGCPRYNVWQQEMQGRAELSRAEQNRQIKIQEAKAIYESSKYQADAEVERAKGAAKANEIIGNSLKGNEDYLRYLYINGLVENNKEGKEIIYIPTEAGLPILEANRFKH